MNHPKNMILRSNNSPSCAGGLGFITRYRRTIPNGYQLLGYANTREQARRIIFPN